MPVYLKALALQNYRGIGPEMVRMPYFKTFNFFIGANNAGKSTVLNFISRHLPITLAGSGPPIDPLERHEGSSTPITMAVGAPVAAVKQSVLQKAAQINQVSRASLDTVLARLADDNGIIWLSSQLPYQKSLQLLDPPDFSEIGQFLPSHSSWSQLWSALTGQGQGGIQQHWFPQTLGHIARSMDTSLPEVRLIPALRQIGPASATPNDFSGSGLIERLAEIQSPDFDRRSDRETFNKINSFLQTVVDAPQAQIEIPHNRAHVLVHMDGKVLPLSSLGTGIHEVIMIAAFCTISSDMIVCIEEPELHLHPLLQRKLVDYLVKNTSNQYFIATHSASFIDTPGAAVFHVRQSNGQTKIDEAVLKRERHAICTDLGHRASDLVQSNSIIWVEGPSDRIYLNHWIRAANDALREGIHYSIMFYGGRLLSHLSANDAEIDEFIELRSLNRHLAILMDSDRTSAHAPINATKLRIKREFAEHGGIAWVTKGREVENYIQHGALQASVAAVAPNYGSALSGGQFDHALHYRRNTPKRARKGQPSTNLGETNVDKVKVSRHLVDSNAANLDVLDLRARISELVHMIEKANA